MCIQQPCNKHPGAYNCTVWGHLQAHYLFNYINNMWHMTLQIENWWLLSVVSFEKRCIKIFTVLHWKDACIQVCHIHIIVKEVLDHIINRNSHYKYKGCTNYKHTMDGPILHIVLTRELIFLLNLKQFHRSWQHNGHVHLWWWITLTVFYMVRAQYITKIVVCTKIGTSDVGQSFRLDKLLV